MIKLPRAGNRNPFFFSAILAAVKGLSAFFSAHHFCGCFPSTDSNPSTFHYVVDVQKPALSPIKINNSLL